MTRQRISDAELRALRAYLEAGSVRGAALSLGRSEWTVKRSLANVRSKLGVDTNAQAVFRLYRRLAA